MLLFRKIKGESHLYLDFVSPSLQGGYRRGKVRCANRAKPRIAWHSGLFWTVLLLFELAGQSVPLTDAHASELSVRKLLLVSRFQRDIDQLAREWKQSGVDTSILKAWPVDRVPQCMYVFLGSHSYAPHSHYMQQPWGEEFRRLREEHAERLWSLAQQAALGGEVALSMDLIRETLRESPNHRGATAILRRLRAVPVSDTHRRPIVRVGRVRHSRFGWEQGAYWHVESPYFRVSTNRSHHSAVQLVTHLEDLHAVWQTVFATWWISPERFRDVWGGASLRHRSSKRFQVILFNDRQEYLSSLRLVEPQIEMSVGIYRGTDRTSYFYAGDETLTATWLHEVTHQMFHETGRNVNDVGATSDYWIVEGMAMLMESMRRNNGFAVLGGIEARRLQFARYRALNERFYVPLAELVVLGREHLQHDSRIRRLYSQAAGLSQCLMTAENGRYRDGTIRYFRDVYRGRSDVNGLDHHCGMPLPEIDALYTHYLQVTDSDLERLKRSDDVRTLCLGRTDVTDRGMRHLTKFSHLSWLDLTDCDVGDLAIQSLKQMQKLVYLNLEGTQITNLGLQGLAKLTSLEELDLSRTGINDQGLEQLTTLTNLSELWLTSTHVSDKSVPVLESMTSLETVHVEGSRMTTSARNRLREIMAARTD